MTEALIHRWRNGEISDGEALAALISAQQEIVLAMLKSESAHGEARLKIVETTK